MSHIRTRLAAATVAAFVVGSVVAGSVAADGTSLASVKNRTSEFRSLHEAKEAGYARPPAPAPLHECISSFSAAGSMGYHYIKGALLDDRISASHPEVLVYAPDSRGELHLAALEYVVFQDAWKAKHGNTMPKLFGQTFMATGFPNRFDIPAFFSLHVWLFKSNPNGMFAPFNPNVTCPVDRQLARVKSKTSEFRSLHEAKEDGYGQPPAPAPLHECISSFDNSGAMGFHFINGALLNGKVDAGHPPVLVYAPDKDGKLRLAALEYVIFKDAWDAAHPGKTPMLFGQMFMTTGFPNRFGIPAFYSLHVWLFKTNPAGMFAPFNPNVSCSAGTASAGTSTTAAAPLAISLASVGDTRQFACAVPAARA